MCRAGWRAGWMDARLPAPVRFYCSGETTALCPGQTQILQPVTEAPGGEDHDTFSTS